MAQTTACNCFTCKFQAFLVGANKLLTTLPGQLVRGPLYDDKIAPTFPQPHHKRDGIPYTGFLPTMRINAPANPYLELNPVTSKTWFLRAIAQKIPAPRRPTRVPYSKVGAQSGWYGRGG
jgi:hypothetical protein